MSARFDPGPAWGFVGNALVALVTADASQQLVEQLDSLTTEESVSAQHLVEILSRAGIESLPSLAVVLRDPEGFRLFVRGSIRLGVFLSGELEPIAAPRAASWSETFYIDSNGFSMELDDGQSRSTDSSYWCDRGVVAAGRVIVDAKHFHPDAASKHVTERPAQRIDTESSVSISSNAKPSPQLIPDQSRNEGRDDAELTASYLRRLIEETRDRDSTTRETAVARAAVAGTSDGDADTDAPETDAIDSHTLDYDHLIPNDPEPPTDESAPPSIEPSPAAGVISSVPGAEGSDSDERSHGEGYEPLGDHDGHTVSVETLRAARGVLQQAATGLTVQAVHCPTIHPNPPHAAHCRTCGTLITDHTITVITRPVLGELRFDSGDSYPIDRPMLIGRRPSAASDVTVSGETARLVTLADPKNVLSKVHLEVRIEDWQVLVVDRNSTNHTIVTLPERTPTQLHPGDAVQIVPGTLIELGGAACARYEVEV